MQLCHDTLAPNLSLLVPLTRSVTVFCTQTQVIVNEPCALLFFLNFSFIFSCFLHCSNVALSEPDAELGQLWHTVCRVFPIISPNFIYVTAWSTVTVFRASLTAFQSRDSNSIMSSSCSLDSTHHATTQQGCNTAYYSPPPSITL
jgi:hypothetical protein